MFQNLFTTPRDWILYIKKNGLKMKKIAAILLTISMTCNAFTTPLALENDPKFRWYRCIYLEACVYDLNDIKSECDQNGWNENTSNELERVINKMKWSLGFPEE